jgi:two-component system, cell cycle sensor histidine kinase and response regulator CckA
LKTTSGLFLKNTGRSRSVSNSTSTILLVEDEAPLRTLIKGILERNGYQVLEAESGKTSFALWEENKDRIELLLTDMIMPDGIQGTDLAKKFQGEKPSLRVVFTSGYTTEVLGSGFVAHDSIRFLQKPFMPAKLIETVRDCLAAA